MNRLAVETADGRLIIRERPGSLVIDAMICLVIAVIVGSVIGGLGVVVSGFRHTLVSALVLLVCLTPCALFLRLASVNLWRCAFPRTTVIDRASHQIVIAGKEQASLSDLQSLRIRFTGASSPSRYVLFADFASGKRIAIASTGYTGTREELQQLTQIIADFTQRFDLYVR